MLTLRQFQILSACADGPELFYAPFARVNYGGQVFEGARDAGAEPGGVNWEGDRAWTVTVPGSVIVDDLLELIALGLVACCKFTPGEHVGDQRGAVASEDLAAELRVYADYDCVTYADHYAKFGGYGPHEFEITESGRIEINRPEYDDCSRQLGWDA